MNKPSAEKSLSGLLPAFIIAIALCAVTHSCEHYVLPEMSVYPDTLYFQAAGGSQPVDIHANVIWRRSDHAGWVSLSCSRGDSDTTSMVSVEANEERERRTTVTIESETIRRNLVIIQEGL